MNILITGATGFIGKELTQRLLLLGHNITVLSRRSEESTRKDFDLPYTYFQWVDPDKNLPPEVAFKNINAVCNLAGEPVANKKWNKQIKQKIFNSRVLLTRNLVARVNRGKIPIFVSSSAIGIYGSSGSQEIAEAPIVSKNFLSQVCHQWEAEALKCKDARISILRNGIVLGCENGILGKLEPLFSRCLGGHIGNGRQYMSWVHIDDLVNLYIACLTNNRYDGIFNATAPNACTNKEFTSALAKAMKAPSMLAVPLFILKSVFGEMSKLMYDNCNATPERALRLGFNFKFNGIREALADIFKWKSTLHDRKYQQKQWINRPLDETFTYFSQTDNLQNITPEWLEFKSNKSNDKRIKKGSLVEYKLRMHGLPFRWTSLISRYNAPNSFTDVQLKGPYKSWHHTHNFYALKTGTLITDEICYRAPLGSIGRIILGWKARKDIDRIFKYRYQKIQQLL